MTTGTRQDHTLMPAAAASAHAAEAIAERVGEDPGNTLGVGLAGIIHALLAVAAAVEGTGIDTGNVLTDLVGEIQDCGASLADAAPLTPRRRRHPRRAASRTPDGL
jgi:hypothetical protein